MTATLLKRNKYSFGKAARR